MKDAQRNIPIGLDLCTNIELINAGKPCKIKRACL